MPRYFTLEEARATLPLVRALLREARAQKRRLDDLRSVLAGTAAKTLGNGHVPEARVESRRQELDELVAALETTLRRAESTGSDILHWHELDAGAVGRQPL